jgi:hypothetical protein
MKAYQLGNYIKDWQKKVAMIIEIDQKGVLAEYLDNKTYKLEWHDFKPIEISVPLMVEIGFSVVKEKDNPYHKDVSMTTVLNGKFYNARGVLYKGNSIWTFNNITVIYLHQVQNIISIIDPTKTLQVLRSYL